MDDPFEIRLRTAVQAGWRALAVGVALISVSWVGYLTVARSRPSWFLALWGPDVTWTDASHVWLWAIAVLKMAVYVLALLVVWGAFWVSQMRKARAASERTGGHRR